MYVLELLLHVYFTIDLIIINFNRRYLSILRSIIETYMYTQVALTTMRLLPWLAQHAVYVACASFLSGGCLLCTTWAGVCNIYPTCVYTRIRHLKKSCTDFEIISLNCRFQTTHRITPFTVSHILCVC